MDGDQLQSSMSFTGRKVMNIGKTITESLVKERQKSENPGLTAKVSRVSWSDGRVISESKMEKVNKVVSLLLKTSGVLAEEGESALPDTAPVAKEKIPTFKIGFADGNSLLATKIIKAANVEELSKNINKFFSIAQAKFPESKELRHVMLRADLPDGTSINSTDDSRVMSDLTKIVQALVKPSGNVGATPEAKPDTLAEPEAETKPEDKPKVAEPVGKEEPEEKPAEAPAEEPPAEEKPEDKPAPTPAKAEPPAKPAEKEAPAEKEEKPAEEKPKEEPAPADEKDKDKEVEEAAPAEAPAEVEETGPFADVAKQVNLSSDIIKDELMKVEKAVIARLRRKPSPALSTWYNKGVKKASSELMNELLFKLHLLRESVDADGVKKVVITEAEEETKDIWDIAIDNGFVPQHSGMDLKAKMTKPGTKYELWLTYESPIDILYKQWEIKNGMKTLATGVSADEFEHKLKELSDVVKEKLKESKRRK